MQLFRPISGLFLIKVPRYELSLIWIIYFFIQFMNLEEIEFDMYAMGREKIGNKRKDEIPAENLYM